ncbi:MAG: NAD+ synthase [Acidimicrobiia bacterium]
MSLVRVAGAQINLTVGDLQGNRDRILEAMTWAEQAGADMLLLPELAVTGYPPEDLVLRRDFVEENLSVLDQLAEQSGETVTVVGFVDWATGRPGPGDGDSVERRTANAAALLAGGRVRGAYHKVLLPNYGVFDEDRYFAPGDDPAVLWEIGGAVVGASVCEDIWVPHGPPFHQARAGAQLLCNITASPYHSGKGAERQAMLAERAATAGAPLVYVNLVGGQDELVFDGESMVFHRSGELLYRAAQFEEEMFSVEVPIAGRRNGVDANPVGGRVLREDASEPIPPEAPRLGPEEEVYRALVTGLGDYVRKNGFTSVVVGLSGGIDSSLTAAIAVDALGPDSVLGVGMPARFSSEGSVADAGELAKRLGCRFELVPVDAIFAAYLEALAGPFAGTDFGIAEENLQARIRGATLMALSNKLGSMVVATGNKSEMAVGYATLYGDMAGGFAVLKDVFKTFVYRLARWRNSREEVIPNSVLEKPPSAELRPDQRDSDSLPPYDLLDAILERYVEQDRSVEEIIADGYDSETVRRVARMVDNNEYKRRQAAPGVKITQKAFGKDRRLPITNGYEG